MLFKSISFFHLSVVSILLLQTISTANADSSEFVNVPAKAENWVLHPGESWSTSTIKGRDAFSLKRPAFVKDVELSHGIIEVDIIRTSPRHFAGVLFHANEAAGPHKLPFNESVYVRMHKAGQPDSMQYTPHMNGEANWQLLANHQANNKWPQEEWFTLRVEFDEDQARASIVTGEETKPLNIPHLKNSTFTTGGIGIWALFDGHYSHFRYSTEKPDFPEHDDLTTPSENQITNWRLSNSFPIENAPTEYDLISDQFGWSDVKSNPQDGTLYISNYRRKKNGGDFENNSDDKIWVHLPVEADKDLTKELKFDYSDHVLVTVNGTPVFQGNNAFRAKGPLFRGEFDHNAQSVFLDLKQGHNDVVFEIQERANGWGINAQLDNLENIKLPLRN